MKMNENKEEIEMKMNENKEEIQKYMISIENILLEKLPKRGERGAQSMGSMLSKLERTDYESQNHNHEFSIQYPHH